MVKPELGTKRTCPNCSARFYDLNNDPIVCPKCDYSFVADALLPSKMDQQAPAPAPAPAQRKEPEQEETDNENVDLVSLEDVEKPSPSDSEEEDDTNGGTADDGETLKSADDPFLEEDDEDDGSDVSGIIGVSGDEDEV